MTDKASVHLFLKQRLLPLLLHPEVVIVVHYGTATIMSELCRRHRRSLQIPALVFDASPGISGLLREVDFPAASILRLQTALPLLFIADMPQSQSLPGLIR